MKAKAACELYGAHLVVINDDEENNFISYGLAVSFKKISRTKSKIISKKFEIIFLIFFWKELERN